MSTIQLNDDDPGTEYWPEDVDTVYCAHGRYVGYGGGPDYLCGWCESGATVAEYNGYLLDRERDRLETWAFNEFWSTASGTHRTFRHVYGSEAATELFTESFDEFKAQIEYLSMGELRILKGD